VIKLFRLVLLYLLPSIIVMTKEDCLKLWYKIKKNKQGIFLEVQKVRMEFIKNAKAKSNKGN